MPKTEEEKTVYAVGVALGRNLIPFNFTSAELEMVKAGFMDGARNKEPKVDLATYAPKTNELFKARTEKAAEAERKSAEAFLEKAASEKGAHKTASGLIYTELKAGDGKQPTTDDKVIVQYTNAPLGPLSNLYWLGEAALAMISVILLHIWRIMPLATLILLAGLSSIPHEILEAAEVDGARFWRRHLRITLPLLRPIISIAFLFGLVFTFTDMTVVYVLTRGGPVHSTQVLSSWAFFKGIEGGDLAQGAATAIFLFPLLAGVAALILRMARRSEVT